MNETAGQFIVQKNAIKMHARKPGISGFMRVRNEEEFLPLAIDSHLPFLDELVIVYNACSDRTPEIAHDYARRHPDKVKAIHYEPVAFWPGTAEFRELPADSPNSAVNYSNFALCQTTRTVVLKVDADHIALPSAFRRMSQIVRRPWLFPRYGFPRFRSRLGFRGVNLWDQDGAFFVNTREPYTEYVPLFPISDSSWFAKKPLWELLETPGLRSYDFFHFSFYHAKFLKSSRDATFQYVQSLPNISLYSDEMDRRLKPTLVPFAEFCRNTPGAESLPHPTSLGLVAPKRGLAS
jgi:hypothetical protein